METKKCKTCGLIKDINEFPFHNKEEKKYRAHCNVCHRKDRKEKRLLNKEHYQEQNRNSYYKHKEKRINEVKEYQKKNKNKRRKWGETFRLKTNKEWFEWKSTLKCSNCDESHVACLEFHHIDPTKKDGVISKMRFCKLKLKKELKKCIVLCSNCHRKLHYELNNINN